MATFSRVFRPSLSTKAFSIGVRSVSSEVTFELAPCALHKLERGPATSVTCTWYDALKFYRQMLTIRMMEERVSVMSKRREIRALCSLYSGQEACCVGMEAAITPNDAVITSHRSHGWAYIRKATVQEILAELAGKRTGCSQGKGGSIPLFGRKFNFFGGNGIVGAQVDGMDVLAVKEATTFARNYVLNSGPLLIECVTYRYEGHNTNDPGTRSTEEVQHIREVTDPITNFKQKIIEADLVTKDEVKTIEEEVKKEIKEAEEMALICNEPPLEYAYNHVYANPDPDFKVRTCDPLKMVTSK